MSIAANTGVGAQQVNPAGVARNPEIRAICAARWGTQNAAVQRAGQPVSAFGPQAAQPAAGVTAAKLKTEDKVAPAVNAPGSAFAPRP